MSRMLPSLEMPSPYMMSKNTSLNGGATLFLRTVTFVWFPTVSLPALSAPIRRTSNRTLE